MTRFRHLAIVALVLMTCTVRAFANIPRDVLNPTLASSPLRVHSPACAGVTADRCSFVVLFLDAHGNITAMDIEAGLLPVVTPNVMRLKQNAADELTSVQTKANPGVQGWNTATPTHDEEGNLTSDGTLTFGYDYENRLLSVSSASLQETFFYAGDGSRVARSENATTRIHALDHGAGLDAVLMTLNTNGVPVRYYVWAGSLAAHVDAGGAVRYYHADQQGTTLAMTDGNGAVTDQWFISPYGEQMDRTGATVTPYVWIGGRAVWNEGNSLYRMQARYYHMGLKRWIARDPIGMGGGANLYTYANNNPLLFIDAYGLQANVISGGGTDIYYPHGGWNSVNVPGATFEHRTDSGFAVVDDFTKPDQVAFAASGAAVGIGVAGYYAAPYVVAGGTKVVAAVTAAGAAGREAMYRLAASQPMAATVDKMILYYPQSPPARATVAELATAVSPYAEAFAAGLSQAAPTPHQSVGTFVADLAGQATYKLATVYSPSGSPTTGYAPSGNPSFADNAGRPPK